MNYGYARSSRNIEGQIVDLRKNNCDHIFQDKLNGNNLEDLKELHKLLETVKSGDAIIVTSLSRISRNSGDLIPI